MSSFGWVNASSAVRSAVETVQQELQQTVGPNLLGIYLHGSLALGCFNPVRSDVDLLATIGEGMAVETKRAVALSLLGQSAAPYPIEISFVCQQDVQPWQFPTPFDFHYSKMWRVQVAAELRGGAWRDWNERPVCRDSDLAAHITLARARGIALLGLPANQAFPPVPPADYLAAILEDCTTARDRIVADPIYGVLTLCRVYAYVLEGHIYSKDEAGMWVCGLLPPTFERVVRGVLTAYRSEPGNEQFLSDELPAFATYMDERIQAAASALVPDRKI